MAAIHEINYKGVLLDQTALSKANIDQLPQEVIDQIAQKSGLELPTRQVEQEAYSLMQGYLARQRYEQLYSRQPAFYRNAMESGDDDMFEHFRRQAANELMEEKILREIILAETIRVTEEELEEEGRQIAKRQGITLADIKEFFGEDLSLLKRDLQKRKARKLIYAFAKQK